MVEKLSSVKIITAACLVTSVPVPIAIPMPAFFTAGASLTPSPVIATIWPFFLRTSTRRTLCSGLTRAITPMPSTVASASSSLMAPNPAPVIIRTLIPAALAAAIDARAAGRGGSAMPARAGSSSPVTRPSRPAPG
jgi:hypothetical protein